MSAGDARVERSLRLSVREGIFASCMTGFTQEYLAPFLISIQASTRQVGLLSAVPNLAAALVQLRSTEITERIGSRRRTLSVFVLLQAVTLLPMAGVALSGMPRAAAFVALATVFTVLGAVATPAWGSLMADLVPVERRGEYFGFRSMVVGVATMGSMLAAGLVIHVGRHIHEPLGFALVFSAAALFRLVSWRMLRRLYEPPPDRSAAAPYTFADFARGAGHPGFTRYVVSVALMSFAVNLAAPYFAVLMLRDLGFSYLLYSAIMVTAGVSVFAAIRRWGVHADRVGNIRVIRATAPVIVLLPLLWIAWRNPLWLAAVQVLSGFAWAGFNLAASNFVYDALPPASRTAGIAHFNVVNGIALFAGAVGGGYLAGALPPLAGHRILALLLASAAARLAVYVLAIRGLRDVRDVPRVGSVNLFVSMVGVRPLLGIERKTLRY